MSNKTPLSQQMKQKLDSLIDAEQTADKMVAQANGEEKGNGAVKENDLLHDMQKPSWKMTANNRLFGELDERFFSIDFEVVFNLDVKTLFNTVTRNARVDDQVVKEMVQTQVDEDDVLEAVVESIHPRALGVMDGIEVKKWSTPKDWIKRRQELENKPWVVKMTLEDDLVHFNYAPMINSVLNDIHSIEEGVFSEKVWVGLEMLRGSQPMTHNYQVHNNGVIMEIEVLFEPI